MLTDRKRTSACHRLRLSFACLFVVAILLRAGGLHAATQDSTSPPSMDCRYSSGDSLQCSTPSTGSLLNINFELLNPDGGATKLASKTSSGDGDASWEGAGTTCRAIATRLSAQNGVIRLGGRHDCASPVRLCIAMQSPQPDATVLGSVAVIRTRGLALSIVGDSRLGTQIDPGRKSVRLCTDPKRLRTAEWAIELRSGSIDAIRDSLQAMPAPLLDSSGKVIGYAKKSPVVKDGYLFVDLTENNAPALLPLIQKSSFPYTLIYGRTWASSMGSYAFSPGNYPGGLAGLKRVVDAANARGIKIGLHTLTGSVSKSDPYVRNGIPDARLLYDDRSTLLGDIDAKATTIVAADSLGTFPTRPAFYGSQKAGLDLRIGDEIISCPTIVVGERGEFKNCRRGLYGTQAAAHSAGTAIAHLVERFGGYLADLGSSIKDEIGDRLSAIVNQGGIDMIYFDGGEVGGVNGDANWYVAEQQIEVLRRVRRPLLVEGSGIVPRLWPFMTRMVDDDFAALAPIDYLDTHKIGRVHRHYVNSMMPDNLGWLGLLKETPGTPATTHEEISTYVARSLALDIPLSIETTYDDLLKNPYGGRLLDILSAGNQTIRAGVLSAEARDKLSQGEWYFTQGDGPRLNRLRLVRIGAGSATSARPMRAAGDERQAFLRIRNIRQSSPDEAGTITLINDSVPPRTIDEVAIVAGNRGALVESVNLGPGAPVDLRSARAMMVDFDYPAKGRAAAGAAGDGCAVLNIQLEDNQQMYRDYFLTLRPAGRQQVVIDDQDSPPVMLRTLMPAAASYAFKAAVYGFNFAAVSKLNIRWMSSCGQGVPLRLIRVAMIKENPGRLNDIGLKVGNKLYPVVGEIGSGETLDVLPDGQLSVCREAACSTRTIDWPSGAALAGQTVGLDYRGKASAEITLGLLGEPVAVGAGQAQKR